MYPHGNGVPAWNGWYIVGIKMDVILKCIEFLLRDGRGGDFLFGGLVFDFRWCFSTGVGLSLRLEKKSLKNTAIRGCSMLFERLREDTDSHPLFVPLRGIERW